MPVTVRAVVLFPFTLGSDQNENDRILDTLKMTLDVVQGAHPSIELHDCPLAPILFVNRISEKRGYFSKIEEFLSGERHAGRWQIVYGWSVDTCQDWLHAWGTVIDEWQPRNPDDKLLMLQIPGDLRDVGDDLEDADDNQSRPGRFYRRLEQLVDSVKGGSHLAIGDYSLRQMGAKTLIDQHGTFPLLANWFPEIAKRVRDELGIRHPRSEFIAADVDFLAHMLINYRRFAYEQTTVLLINALFSAQSSLQQSDGQPLRIRSVDLGTIQDHTGQRGFREAIDQLERMERMLRVLWRSLNGGESFDVDRYEVLDERSAKIRAAAMVTFRNYLQPSQPT